MAEAFIKLYKKLLKWEWYDDVNTKVVFIHCLLKANWETTKWHGIDLMPGQFITSLASLSKETHLTFQQVRTALKHLETTSEITIRSYNRFRIITVNNWNDYQAVNKQDNKQITNKQQTANKQATTVKEYKEYKNNKNIKPNSFYDFKSKGYDYEALQEEALNV